MTATAAALRAHERRVTRMLHDPECVGELLLVGLALARSVDLGDPGFSDNGNIPLGVVSERVYGRKRLPSVMLLPGWPRSDTNPRRRITAVFREDRRRYDPDADGDRSYHQVTCGRPMIRRDGLCDRNASERKRLTDPATGHRQWVGACSQTLCKQWFADLVERNRQELEAHPPPTPPANTGGVLDRHLPEIDWWKVWQAVDPKWTPPPEGRMFEKPTLTLLVADEDELEAPPVEPARPSLTVIEGGWR